MLVHGHDVGVGEVSLVEAKESALGKEVGHLQPLPNGAGGGGHVPREPVYVPAPRR